jgi:hypothetical protein
MKQFIPPVLWPLFENSTAVGYVLVTLGTAATILLSLVLTRVDRTGDQKKKTPSARRSRTGWALGIAGITLIALGNWLTQKGAARNAVTQEAHAEEIARKTQDKIDHANQELTSKIQEFALELHAARQEETRKQAEEKIDSLKSDFAQWADDFDKRRPAKQKQLELAKTASLQKELQISAESMALFSYVISFIEERLAAYSKRTGHQIRLDIPPLPDNFFAADANSIERSVRFSGGKAQWTFSVSASVPARDDQPPQLQINFTNSDGRGGNVYISRIPKIERFTIGGSGILPASSEVSQMFGQYGMAKFDRTIQELFLPIIEAQLAETP